MESFYFDTTLITISVIGLTSIAGGLTLKLKIEGGDVHPLLS